MPLADLGTSLCVLVYHLYRKYADSEHAFRELCLRTRTPFSEQDAVKATAPSKLAGTEWLREMVKRRAAMQEEIKATHSSEVEETVGLVKSLYPNGCSLSEFADSVQTCTAMLSFTVADQLVRAMIAKQGEVLERKSVSSLSAQSLADIMVSALLVDVFIPLRWWTVYPKDVSFAFLKRIGIALSPPCLCIEYADESGRVRHRTIRLDNCISASGPTGPLARRIVETHDVLISEVRIQKSLVKLQRLMEKSASERNATLSAAAATPAAPPPQSPAAPDTAQAQADTPANTTKPAKGDAQMADLGLLYRDPEKALENVDLNHADEITLQEFKSAMDEKFKVNVLKPGDEGYVYDKRVEVKKPTQKSEWDDSDSD